MMIRKANTKKKLNLDSIRGISEYRSRIKVRITKLKKKIKETPRMFRVFLKFTLGRIRSDRSNKPMQKSRLIARERIKNAALQEQHTEELKTKLNSLEKQYMNFKETLEKKKLASKKTNNLSKAREKKAAKNLALENMRPFVVTENKSLDESYSGDNPSLISAKKAVIKTDQEAIIHALSSYNPDLVKASQSIDSELIRKNEEIRQKDEEIARLRSLSRPDSITAHSENERELFLEAFRPHLSKELFLKLKTLLLLKKNIISSNLLVQKSKKTLMS